MRAVLETLSPTTLGNEVKISPDPFNTGMKELPDEFQLIHDGKILFTLREISIAENPGILSDIESIIEGSGGLDVSIQAFIF